METFMIRPSMFRRRRMLWLAVLASILCFGASAAAQFETRAIVPVGDSPTSITVGDFNHDGSLDIAVATAKDQMMFG